jgi:hypothetical protein
MVVKLDCLDVWLPFASMAWTCQLYWVFAARETPGAMVLKEMLVWLASMGP